MLLTNRQVGIKIPLVMSKVIAIDFKRIENLVVLLMVLLCGATLGGLFR